MTSVVSVEILLSGSVIRKKTSNSTTPGYCPPGVSVVFKIGSILTFKTPKRTTAPTVKTVK